MKTRMNVLTTMLALALAGLAPSARAEESKSADEPERILTAGLIQRELHEGLLAEEVALALGSPNIVTRDAEGVEAWIYDRISTELRYEQSSKGIGGGGLGAGSIGSTGLAALIGAHVEREKGSTRLSQRCLTLIVKFDAEGRVAAFSYRVSRF